ncbi:aldo/keto reductase [Micromonospora echinospora]|uniref:aldo/keto reductase n=1 Tax=Micromonospora echinospora TaxID=1877 RepID=UPI003436DCD0
MTTQAADATFLLGGDMPVRRIGYGALRLTDDQHWRGPRSLGQAKELLRRAVEWGVNLIDTADSYGLGANEELIAAALHPYPEHLVVATKVGQCRPSPDVWVPLGRPEYLRQQVELSLRRLRVERLDLLQLHRLDPSLPLADQVGALRELQTEGKIRHIGLSKVSADQLDEAMTIADITSVQNPYNVVDRAFEQSLRRCEQLGVAFLAWLPLKQGHLVAAGTELSATAERLGTRPAQVALAWLLQHSPAVLPIPATTSVDHLSDNIAAADLALDPATVETLTRLGERSVPGWEPR